MRQFCKSTYLLYSCFSLVFEWGGVFSGVCIQAVPFAEFRRTLTHVFAEFLMEIVYVLVTDLFCDLIYFQFVFQQKLFRQLNPLMVDV